jgi:hypothetical protein
MVTCDFIGCARPAAWGVGLHLWPAPPYNGPPSVPYLDLRVCESHRASLRLHDVVTDEWWQFIVNAFMRLGRARPVRDRTQLYFELLATAPFGGGGRYARGARDDRGPDA